MKVGLFQEPAGGMGGSELVTAVMADALRRDHEVEIVHHRPGFTVRQLEEFFGLDLSGVHSRFVPPPAGHSIYSGRYLPAARRYWREWDADLSRPYDLFVANVHGAPPHCYARHGVLHVLFPGFAKSRDWPWGTPSRSRAARLLDPIRRRVYEAGWRERMATYTTRLAISEYASRWTEEYWGVGCEVLSPPVLTEALDGPKADAVVALGRFTPEKQQAELLAAFLAEVSPSAPGWEMVFVGGLSDTALDRAYFAELQKTAADRPVRFVANASRSELRAELGRAKIFWHAMGLGVDAEREPNKIEHFGIAPVEAMAAGCVPVVLNRGGPSEVVRDGESGYTCWSLHDMAERIVRLTRDDALRTTLAAAAHRRAADFSADRFRERFLAYTDPVLARLKASSP